MNKGRVLVVLLFAVVCVSALLTGELLAGLKAGARTFEAEALPTLALANPVSGFSQPVGITHAGDGSNRLFVVEQGGRVRIIKNGSLLATPFLDISTRISTGGERGLLGLAFPPAYASSGRFYLNYTDTGGHTIVARYRVGANPDVADPASEQVVLRILQPFPNHNGGQLAFSPRDGFLYIGMGDGGSGGDPGNRAQNPNELLGKMLRIDVETGNPSTYTVPASNPFVNTAGFRPEIWALGMRNPWRFSFDRQTHDLYIADVGQGSWEEINFQPAASAGGENYGWRIMEGTHCFSPSTNCPTQGLTLPIWEYNHAQGDCSVTGGYVYRGAAYPGLQGYYLYGDFCSGRIWGLRREAGVWQNSLLLDASFMISTFGEDQAGNLYVAAHNTGTIWSVTDTAPPPPPPASVAQFSAAQYTVTEDVTTATITVTLAPAPASAVTVEYATADQTALQKTDYTLTAGRLTFAPGETSKTFVVPITEDAFTEGTETLSLTLSNATGSATLSTQSTATLRIEDDGDTSPVPNPIDDASIFVGQHYHDFLSRQADPTGLAFWTNEITLCGADAACVDDRRQNVSAAFFLSIEFQNSGYLVFRFERASFARRPAFAPFLRDTRRITEGIIVNEGNWGPMLDANRIAFSEEWVSRPEFRAVYDSMSREQYVDALFANSEVAPTTPERDAALAAYGAGGTAGRAAALRSIVDSGSVYNKQYNPAFVQMQYFGYLRRSPDDEGFQFWLRKLDEHSRPGEDMRSHDQASARIRRAQMVRSFLVSVEYRDRFGRA